MKILRINNVLNSDNQPGVKTNNGEWWFLSGKLHRANGLPAVKTTYTKLYYHRGIMLTREMAQGLLSILEILKIPNAEQRQASMEIVGHDKFMDYGKVIDIFTPNTFLQKFPLKTNPMYSLVEIKSDDKMELPIKILKMHDPHKDSIYYCRVSPIENNCKEALAHSYDFKTWEDYIKNQMWENVRLN